MKRIALLAFTFFSILGLAPQISADDPLPAGLDQAIRNPKIPIIADATIVKFNKAGHGETDPRGNPAQKKVKKVSISVVANRHQKNAKKRFYVFVILGRSG